MNVARQIRIAGRVLVGITLMLAAWALWFLTGGPFRVLCGLAVLVFSGYVVAYVVGRSARPAIISGLVVAALAASPVEISCAVRAGIPHFAPVIAGYPDLDDRARARRGEVVLAGCIGPHLEPRWVLVW